MPLMITSHKEKLIGISELSTLPSVELAPSKRKACDSFPIFVFKTFQWKLLKINRKMPHYGIFIHVFLYTLFLFIPHYPLSSLSCWSLSSPQIVSPYAVTSYIWYYSLLLTTPPVRALSPILVHFLLLWRTYTHCNGNFQVHKSQEINTVNLHVSVIFWNCHQSSSLVSLLFLSLLLLACFKKKCQKWIILPYTSLKCLKCKR